MLTQLLWFSIWKGHLRHMYVKCVVNMLRQNQKSWNIIKKSLYFFILLNRRSWDFKPLLEKTNPTLIDSFLDNQNLLIKNVSAQPFHLYLYEPWYLWLYLAISRYLWLYPSLVLPNHVPSPLRPDTFRPPNRSSHFSPLCFWHEDVSNVSHSNITNFNKWIGQEWVAYLLYRENLQKCWGRD